MWQKAIWWLEKLRSNGPINEWTHCCLPFGRSWRRVLPDWELPLAWLWHSKCDRHPRDRTPHQDRLRATPPAIKHKKYFKHFMFSRDVVLMYGSSVIWLHFNFSKKVPCSTCSLLNTWNSDPYWNLKGWCVGKLSFQTCSALKKSDGTYLPDSKRIHIRHLNDKSEGSEAATKQCIEGDC